MAIGFVALYALPSPVGLAGLGVFAVVAYFHFDLALLAVVLASPFYLQALSVGGLSFSPVELLVVTLAGVWALRRVLLRRAIEVRPTATDVLIVLLVGASLTSLLASEHIRESLRVLRTVIVEPVVFFYLATTSLSRRAQVLRLGDALVVAGTVVALVALYQFFFTQDIITAEGVRRVKAFYGSPNNLSLFLGRAIPVGLSLALFGPRNGPLPRIGTPFLGAILGAGRRPWLYAGATAIMAIAMLLTYSLGGYAGLAAAVIFMAAVRGKRWLIGAGLVAVPGVLGLALFAGIQRLQSHLDLQFGTTFFRLNLWHSSLNMVRDHPILGIGLDNFLYRYREQYILPGGGYEPDLSHPHNWVLDFWLNLGLGGLVVAVLLLGVFFLVGLRLYWRLQEKRERALTLGVVGSMAAFLAHGTVDNSFFLVDLAVAFWLAVAVVHLLDRLPVDKEEKTLANSGDGRGRLNRLPPLRSPIARRT